MCKLWWGNGVKKEVRNSGSDERLHTIFLNILLAFKGLTKSSTNY